MRSILVTTILTLGVLFGVFYSSCTKDDCNNVVCQNAGACDGGRCICAAGFYGDKCELPIRNLLIGTYNGGDSCTKNGGEYAQYGIKFLADPNPKILNRMVLKNILNNPVDSAICTMVTNDSFVFNGANNSITYRGSGKFIKDSLFMSYNVQFDTVNYDCKFFGLKY